MEKERLLAFTDGVIAVIITIMVLEMKVPQDRMGRFSTELFARYQRSEKALVGTLAVRYVQEFRRARSRR